MNFREMWPKIEMWIWILGAVGLILMMVVGAFNIDSSGLKALAMWLIIPAIFDLVVLRFVWRYMILGSIRDTKQWFIDLFTGHRR